MNSIGIQIKIKLCLPSSAIACENHWVPLAVQRAIIQKFDAYKGFQFVQSALGYIVYCHLG